MTIIQKRQQYLYLKEHLLPTLKRNINEKRYKQILEKIKLNNFELNEIMNEKSNTFIRH